MIELGIPIWPVVPLSGAPTFHLAKLLFRNLWSLTSDATTTVCSANQFLQQLQGVKITPDEIMVSFDVTSPFTSIPQGLAVDTVNELLERRYNETEETVKRRYLIQLLKFCQKTYFTFEGTTHEQVKRMPEAVLRKVETLVFAKYKPKFWTRYVDDTFVIIERKMVKEFHESLNSIFPDIHFTMEVEVNNQLPFLDVLVHREPSGDLKTTMYRKATSTRQILSYHSKHPLCHKRICLRTPYKRTETHCSEPGERKAELRYLQRLFMANGYPATESNVADSAGKAEGQRPNSQRYDSGHTFAFQNSEILGRESDRVARKTIDAWYTGTTSINRCVTLPTAYQALRTQLHDQKSQREHGPNVHPNKGESIADTHAIATQPRPDEGTVIASASSTNYSAVANTYGGEITTWGGSFGR
ncbi:unnamed protein product [Schistocephalus solidus]|uniref:Reverse transcriptase domain-containing protein n=1 Tax=Schistocephalus solidus TaxID=70667 RepID=A0A183SUL7_SCHSO|nr:unnamed protein product [Schistocephalus solidus]